MGFTSCMHYFSPRNKFKLQFRPYSSPFFYLAFDNKSVKGEQSAIPALFFMMSSKPQELKPLD